VMLLGDEDFDVSRVDPSSLHLHGARMLRADPETFAGRPALRLQFDMRDVGLRPGARKARLTGSLQNSQIFIADVAIGATGP